MSVFDGLTAQEIYQSAVSMRSGDKSARRKSVIWLKKAASMGHSEAQHSLGVHYEIVRNYTEAVRWFKLAAENSHSDAQKDLAFMYQEGRGGLEQDYQRALELYLLSAQQNNCHAQGCLGYIYEKGLGVESDIKKAIYWYRLSAENGSKTAPLNLKRLGAL